jgi:hypothetical protein
MGTPKLDNLSNRDAEVKDLLLFVRNFARLMDQQLIDTRKIMEKTVEQMMTSVSAINAAADLQLKKADEVLVKDYDKQTFVSKSAREIDSNFADPAARVKVLNEHISAHMATLGNLDDSVRSVLFSIMGALSMDDVIRQRLEHVTTSINAMESGVGRVLADFSAGHLTDVDASLINNEMADKMFRSFTMEEEKTVFRQVLGDIKNFRKS